jgi:hypothetical protein
LVKNLTIKKLAAKIVKGRLIKKTPKGEKEKVSSRNPALTAHHMLNFKLPKDKINIKITKIKLKLFKARGRPEIKENCKNDTNIINNAWIIILIYIKTTIILPQ